MVELRSGSWRFR